MRKVSELIRIGHRIALANNVDQGFGNYADMEEGQRHACVLMQAYWGLHPDLSWSDLYSANFELTPDYANNDEGLQVPVELLEATGLKDSDVTIKGSNPLLWALLQNDDVNIDVLEIADALEKEGF